MNKMQVNASVSSYDPRWFVWTIMFLVVTGVGLVTYITVTNNETSESQVLVKHRSSPNMVQSK